MLLLREVQPTAQDLLDLFGITIKASSPLIVFEDSCLFHVAKSCLEVVIYRKTNNREGKEASTMEKFGEVPETPKDKFDGMIANEGRKDGTSPRSRLEFDTHHYIFLHLIFQRVLLVELFMLGVKQYIKIDIVLLLEILSDSLLVS